MLHAFYLFFYLPLLMLVGLSHADYCTREPTSAWQEESGRVGGDNGTPFCDSLWQWGHVVTGLKVVAIKKKIQQITVYFSDQSSYVHGVLEGGRVVAQDEKHWEAGTKVKAMKLWANNDKRYNQLGRLRLELSDGQALDIGGEDYNPQETNIRPHSGIVIGAEGNIGYGVDNFGLLFLKSEIKSSTLIQFEFKDSLEKQMQSKSGIDQFTIDERTFNHTVGSNAHVSFAKTEIKKSFKEFAVSNTKAVTSEHTIGVSAQIPYIGVGADFSKTDGTTTEDFKSETTREEHEVDMSYEYSFDLNPGQVVHCKATGMSGKFNSDFTAILSLKLESGEEYWFNQTGSLKLASWSQSNVTCIDLATGKDKKEQDKEEAEMAEKEEAEKDKNKKADKNKKQKSQEQQDEEGEVEEGQVEEGEVEEGQVEEGQVEEGQVEEEQNGDETVEGEGKQVATSLDDTMPLSPGKKVSQPDSKKPVAEIPSKARKQQRRQPLRFVA